MGLFRYEAVDKTGKVVRGAMNARDESAVAQALAAKGYAARGIQPASGSSRPHAAAAPQPPVVAQASSSAVGATGVPMSVNSIVSAHALAVFFRQLATMVRSGMPVTQGLTESTTVARERHLSRALPDMQAAVNSGRSLSGAMAAHPKIFPVYAISVVWCGELGGKLEIALDELASEFEQEASDTRFGRIGWGITKISIVLLVLSMPFFNMGTLLAPIVSDVSSDGSVNSSFSVMSFIARAMPGVLTVGLPIAVVLIGSWVAWGYIKRVPEVRRILDAMLLRSPSWGKLHRYRSLARFLHFMDMLYAAGVNPATAWDAASLTARNNEIAQKLRASREAVGTTTVGELARMSGVLNPEDVALIAGAEKAGDVPATFARLAGMYADHAALQKTMSKTWSVSFVFAAQLAIGGAAMIFMASSYAKVLYKLMGF